MARESLILVGSCDEPMRGWLRALRGGDGSLRWERWTNHPLGGPALALTGDILVAASADRSATSVEHQELDPLAVADLRQ